MEALLILIPVTLFIGFLGLLLFFWALGTDQFDDLDTPAIKILFDDDKDLIP